MEFCMNCGSQLQADDKFCAGCGTPQNEKADEGDEDLLEKYIKGLTLLKKIMDHKFDDIDEEENAQKTIFKIFDELVKQGYEDAYESMSTCYRYGYGVNKDAAKAKEWKNKATEAKKAKKRKTAASPIEELFIEENAEATSKIKTLADQGNAEALYFLGLCYFQGNGVEECEKKGEQYTLKAASLGFAKASYGIASWYELGGRDIEQDYDKAIECYRKAAEQGYPNAKEKAESLKQSVEKLKELDELVNQKRK